MAYSYCLPVIIDHTKVPADLANFPLLFSGTHAYLKTEGNGGSVKSASGYDIIFAADAEGSTKLDHEVEVWDAATGLFIAWVRIPSLSSSADTTIYLLYGDDTVVSSQQNATGVWVSYAAVHHANASNIDTDSSANGYHLDTGASGPTIADGKIYKAASFNGSQVRYRNAAIANFPYAPSGHPPFTLECWFKTSKASGSQVFAGWGRPAAGAGNQANLFHNVDTGKLWANFYSYGDSAAFTNDGGWHHFAVTYPSGSTVASQALVYIDGNLASSSGVSEGNVNIWQQRWTIGAHAEGLNKATALIDEVRVSTIERSSAWIAAQYANQNSPQTFYGIPGEVAGTAGMHVRVRFGVDGALGNPVRGVSGMRVRVRFGTGGKVGIRISGTAGMRLRVRFGSGGKLSCGIHGGEGMHVRVRFGSTGVVLQATERNVTVFRNGVDVSRFVKVGIRRSMQMGGGSRASCEFTLTNHVGGAMLDPSLIRWNNGDEIIIYEGAGRFFAGLLDTTDEFSYTGRAGLVEIGCKCVDYGALCDRRIVGRKYETWAGNWASILMGQIALRYLADLGITFVFTFDPAINLGPMTFNWVTCSEAFNQIAEAVNCEWRIDFYKNLYLVDKDTGYVAAPFSITDNDGNWAEMRVERSAMRRRNRQGIRNSQDLKTLWTDTFSGDGETRILVPMAMLQSKPIVRVDGVDEIVTGLGDYNADYDWIWQPLSIYKNQAKAAPARGAVITLLYPSPLSHVEWAEDAADIAANGLWEAVDEVRDVPNIPAMQAIAASALARGKVETVTASYRTDKKGLEPGQTQAFSTTRPLCSETLLIQQVDSEEQGKKFFRHQIRASNVELQRNPIARWQKLLTSKRQPKDRVMEVIRFTLAETYEGADNPGLAVGAKQAVATATKSGVLSQVSLYFKSGATTDLVEIDLYQNGVTVFSGDKMLWPVGGSGTPVLNYIFTADPLLVVKGDVFTLEVLQADSAAKDGVLELSICG